MAKPGPKSKGHVQAQKPASPEPTAPAEPPPQAAPTPPSAEPRARLYWLAMIAWVGAFLVLSMYMMLDLIRALFFRGGE